jgi:hypothetical protein
VEEGEEVLALLLQAKKCFSKKFSGGTYALPIAHLSK